MGELLFFKILCIGFDVENLSDPQISRSYHGDVTTDQYGRKIPKHAHGTANLGRQTSSTKLIVESVMELYDRIVVKNLLIRRINITANHVVDEKSIIKSEAFEQFDLFTDYNAIKKKHADEEAQLEREKRAQMAMLSIKKKFGRTPF